MWSYEKRLQFPVNIKEPNAKLAQVIISQYGGPDGEMGASMRYLSQRYATPYREVAGLLTDIGTEELAHLEMVATIVHQLTRNLSMEEIEKSGFAPYYTDHTIGIWPQAAGGIPFNACEFQSKGDVITDLFEDMAADATLSQTQNKIIVQSVHRILLLSLSPAKNNPQTDSLVLHRRAGRHKHHHPARTDTDSYSNHNHFLYCKIYHNSPKIKTSNVSQSALYRYGNVHPSVQPRCNLSWY